MSGFVILDPIIWLHQAIRDLHYFHHKVKGRAFFAGRDEAEIGGCHID